MQKVRAMLMSCGRNAWIGGGLVLWLAGCASAPQVAPDAYDVACEDPRPEICTLDYRPVCAVHDDGSESTASNGCGACSDPTVIGYRKGACE